MRISTTLSAIFILTFFTTNSIAQNVGIGVATPLQKLHVGGNVRVDGMATPGTGVITTNASGDLLRTNFSGNANDVLKGNGTFGTVPGGLPSGAIVASNNSNDANLIAAGFSFFGELPMTTTVYTAFTGSVSSQFTQAPTYENGDPAKTQPPSGRVTSVGLWTGTEAIIWGGFNNDGYKYIFYNDGSKYNPLTDTWTPMSTVNAPSSRVYPAAVYSGTEMLVWGGLDTAILELFGEGSYVFANTGGRYNPSTNVWTTMSATGAPLSRYRTASVWTGSYMLVWGGQDQSNIPFSDGARYQPSTDTWFPMNTTGPNFPGTDYNQRMFWNGTSGSGSRVIVLGNGDSIGRYNPVTNAWDPVTTFPGGYYDKGAALWTGSELWIYDKGSNTLYKYNPSLNTWAAPIVVGGSITLDPDFQILNAVWSDAEMILYGNITDANNKVLQNRYYRYNPGSNDFNPDYNEIFTFNRLVQWEPLFFKAGSMIIKWGGYITLDDQGGLPSNYFSRQGMRLYLSSGVSIPTVYVPAGSNQTLYLYKRN